MARVYLSGVYDHRFACHDVPGHQSWAQGKQETAPRGFEKASIIANDLTTSKCSWDRGSD